jgi:hypothetical protein
MNRLTRGDERAISFRWWFRPAVTVIDGIARVAPRAHSARVLALVVKHGTKINPRSGRQL